LIFSTKRFSSTGKLKKSTWMTFLKEVLEKVSNKKDNVSELI